jgi:hypothetical protein
MKTMRKLIAPATDIAETELRRPSGGTRSRTGAAEIASNSEPAATDPKTAAELAQQLNLIGSFRSGVSDLSSNRKKYLRAKLRAKHKLAPPFDVQR